MSTVVWPVSCACHVIVTCSNQLIDQAATISLAERQQTSSSVEDSNLGQCEAFTIDLSQYVVVVLVFAGGQFKSLAL